MICAYSIKFSASLGFHFFLRIEKRLDERGLLHCFFETSRDFANCFFNLVHFSFYGL